MKNSCSITPKLQILADNYKAYVTEQLNAMLPN